jgi:hypothetical protein
MHYTARSILSILCMISLLLSHSVTYGHGFSADTLVQLSDGSWQTIHTICLRALDHKVLVSSYNIHASRKTNQVVRLGGRSRSNCYMRLGFAHGFNGTTRGDIECTPMQEFYMPETGKWVQAYTLKAGDALLAKGNITKSVTYIQFVPKPLEIYTLEIKKLHTFFVSNHSILTHNMILPMAFSVGLSIPFGSAGGAATGSFFGPFGLVIGGVVGGIVGLAVKAIYDNRVPTYNVSEYDIDFINTYRHKAVQYGKNGNDIDCYVIQSLNDTVYEPVLNVTIEMEQGSCSTIYMPSPKEPKRDDEENKKNSVKICEKSAEHIFRNKRGHFADTANNRQLLIEVVSNKENFLGIDQFGNEWYGKILSDGKQVWASVRNNIIRNGGLNEYPKVFNPKTGLCRA